MWKSESASITFGPLNTQFLQRGPGDQSYFTSIGNEKELLH